MEKEAYFVMHRLNSSNRVAGVKQTKAAVAENKVQVVYLACDAAPTMTEPIARLCREKGIELISDCTRKELAKACRIDVLCAAAAVLK